MVLFPNLALAAWAFAAIHSSHASPNPYSSNATCRNIPGDARWPSPDDWKQLNSTISGRLIATIPLGSPCHDPHYDATKCSFLKEQWDLAEVHVQSPSSVMMPWFQNGTCDPFHSEPTACTLGNLVEYSINASCAADIAAGIKFAQGKNIRLAIKNTGHDFAGKNTGKGGLGIWTHNLNFIDILMNYTSSTYKGPAMKMGSGTQAAAAYDAAHKLGYRILGGTCPTVGLAGGYTQGGGHSALSSIYGLGADNVLEWEVVTADGTPTVASPSKNSDLYWALSGGGGGTFGTVVSMTTKMYPDGPTGGASLSFNMSSTSPDAFWNAINLFQAGVGPIADTGAVMIYEVTNSSMFMFMTAPERSKAQVTTQLQYITDHLTKRKIAYTLSVTSDSSYYDHYVRYYGPLPDGIWEVSHLIGSRLIPRSVVESNSSALTHAYRDITANGDFRIVSIALNASHAVAGNARGTNAIHPAWRTALLHTLAYSPWDWSAPKSTMLAREDVLTNVIEPQLVALTPGSGTYLNEANFNMKNAQAEFYGSNLERLRSVKRKYDPLDLFYAPTAVGSEAWRSDADGRLCRSY